MQPNENDEVINLEELAKAGKEVPRATRYRIRVDKTQVVVDGPTITGAQILTVAGKVPPERFRLDQKFRDGSIRKVELTQVVDLTSPGLERFFTIPLDQTEGNAR